MEEAIAQGKPINKEQEEVLRSKPTVLALINELNKPHQLLAQAVAEELSLSPLSASTSPTSIPLPTTPKPNRNDKSDLGLVEDLLNLLYFGSLFDVKSQGDFTTTMLTRTHVSGCCLTYNYVTDDATDLLNEWDFDSISSLGGLLMSRRIDSSLSHKNALLHCIEHAKLWLTKSDQPIDSNANLILIFRTLF
ncbi:hypothetical protein SO802_025259 [Lithocarpus litseifolius]|uniref:Uncharacterized protein n=1 Tax=Lithocarpus litseifolius TaxID=425828 RepID=A0AAW2BZS9_9ROSI